MDTPRLALRFREFTPRVDTIAEHREMIRKRGVVLWGWWKKQLEDPHTEFLASLIQATGPKNPIWVLLVNPSDERMYRARAVGIHKGSTSLDLTLCPLYYRNIAENIEYWFVLNSIEDAAFDESLAEKFGESTLIEL